MNGHRIQQKVVAISTISAITFGRILARQRSTEYEATSSQAARNARSDDVWRAPFSSIRIQRSRCIVAGRSSAARAWSSGLRKWPSNGDLRRTWRFRCTESIDGTESLLLCKWTTTFVQPYCWQLALTEGRGTVASLHWWLATVGNVGIGWPIAANDMMGPPAQCPPNLLSHTKRNCRYNAFNARSNLWCSRIFLMSICIPHIVCALVRPLSARAHDSLSLTSKG